MFEFIQLGIKLIFVLQRSKTISNMCYSKQRVKDSARNQGSYESNLEQHQALTNSPNSKALTYDQSKSPTKDGSISSNSRSGDNLSQDLNSMSVNDNGVATIPTGRTTANLSSDQVSELGKVKQVHLHKHDSDELGMAILGGIEHGLPIMISEVFPGSSVARSQKVCY